MLSGCVGSGILDPTLTDARPDSSPTPTEHDVDLPACPEKPEALARANVAEFATQFEAAYAARRTLEETLPVEGENIISLGAGGGRAETANGTRIGDGFGVNFTATGARYEYHSPAHETTIVADAGLRHISYFFDDETVRRSGRVPDLVETHPRDGRNVQCPPS